MQSAALIDLESSWPDLPVREVLPELKRALAGGSSAVLVAPPGAGKTSLVAPSLLEEAWLDDGRILLMLPRRLAARAAAERIATLLGEDVGGRVGYRTRLESRVGPAGRIECLTYGIFVNRLIAEPDLAGVSALLFDEVHERGIDMDVGLALALEAQQLRPELRLLAMSATLDGGRFSQLLSAPLIESQGRQYPIELRHVGRGAAPLEERMARTIEAAMASEDGSLLAFLPGVAEIERTAEQLRLPADIMVHRLHGTADPAAQRAAIAPGAGRRCVLATAIAETSLTIPGVRLVVDSGLARRSRHSRSSGLSRLVTERVSQAAAAQRAGRAGRQSPGIVWRLWDEGETRGLIPFDPPEIVEADLAPMLLRLAAWGVRDPAQLAWLEPPPTAAIAAARDELLMLGAVDSDFRLTEMGRRMVRLPVAPRLAVMLLEGARRRQADLAAAIAVLLEERGAGGNMADLESRLVRFRRDGGKRHSQLQRRWAEQAQRLAPPEKLPPLSPALLLATAFPDRVARRRRAPGPSDRTADYLMANGRGVAVETTEPLARAEWLVVADAGGAGATSRVRLAASLEPDELDDWARERVQLTERLGPDVASGRIMVERSRKLGAIELGRERIAASPAAIADFLLGQVVEEGIHILPWPDSERHMLERLRFASDMGLSLIDASDDGLKHSVDHWLRPRLDGVKRLADVRLDGALAGLLDWQQSQALNRFAPARLETPAGTSHEIDYGAEGSPEVEVRVQALFGQTLHPMLANGQVPLTLILLSPAGRPLARTCDLPGFWRGGWRDVQREMKGRYPKHPWPDDPAAARPTTRTKAADKRREAASGC